MPEASLIEIKKHTEQYRLCGTILSDNIYVLMDVHIWKFLSEWDAADCTPAELHTSVRAGLCVELSSWGIRGNEFSFHVIVSVTGR